MKIYMGWKEDLGDVSIFREGKPPGDSDSCFPTGRKEEEHGVTLPASIQSRRSTCNRSCFFIGL